PRFERLWTYYRNPCESQQARDRVGGLGLRRSWAGRCYRLGQEMGLPDRLIGPRDPSIDDRAHARREVVIENDIAWRIQSMVDFMFGKPVQILSTARDEATRRTIERILDAAWEASGGIALLQDMSLLGHVYGHVDLLLRAEGAPSDAPSAPVEGVSPAPATDAGSQPAPSAAELRAIAAAQALRIEVVDPTRGIPILNPSDYRRILAYIVHFDRELNEVERSGTRLTWRALVSGFSRAATTAKRATSTLTEIISADHAQIYEDDRLIFDAPNFGTPGELPVVHIQNVSEPFRYEGLGEDEPMIPLQDE
ncbi:MAG: phage portal protein, partial [Candidatus Rokubacteria bacterium]|nr:phage portal protein [Candidatus Rokubacteria bacterium]